jgi:hypothetical protein
MNLCHEICLEYPGPLDDRLRPFDTWEPCGIHSVHKIRNAGCIFDRSLYYRTDGRYGFDFCKTNFEDVVILHEDFFDVFNNMNHPNPYEIQRNKMEYGKHTLAGAVRMRSAMWANISTELGLSAACGAASGDLALVFAGRGDRHAITRPLNMSTGGYVIFKLKYGPDEDKICNELHGSDDILKLWALVHLKYSVDFGRTWVIIAFYKMNDIKGREWVKIKEMLPPEAQTEHTMFKWDQRMYSDNGDYWALDDVQIKRQMKKGWQDGPGQAEIRREAFSWARDAQCCLDSYQCPAWNVENR